MPWEWDASRGNAPIFIPFQRGKDMIMKANIPKGGSIRNIYPTGIINNYLMLSGNIFLFERGGVFSKLRVMNSVYFSLESFFSKKGFF